MWLFYMKKGPEACRNLGANGMGKKGSEKTHAALGHL
jgi:hypothetical protein